MALSIPDAVVIKQAAGRIKPYVHRTAVLTSAFFDQHTAASLFFKCENFQKAGAFKSRGAMNASLSLEKHELKAGVATHSSGNHAQALARAALLLGTKAYIVMPNTAPAAKVAAVREYQGEITFCEPTLQAREDTLKQLIKRTAATEIHPYNDYRVIAGQATAAMEMIGQCPPLDYILCPVGGGGLLSGTALSAHYFSPHTKVIGCEPKGADDAFVSFQSKSFHPSISPQTVADGLLTSLGSLTFPIILQHVHDIVVAEEAEIIQAMQWVWERMKIIIEPSAAVPLAVALSGKLNLQGKNVGIIFSGGNLDLKKMPWL